VVARFRGAPPEGLRLQYWRSRWPQRKVPKDRTPGEGRGVVGTGRLVHRGVADGGRGSVRGGEVVSFTFRPLHETEFPDFRIFPRPSERPSRYG